MPSVPSDGAETTVNVRSLLAGSVPVMVRVLATPTSVVSDWLATVGLPDGGGLFAAETTTLNVALADWPPAALVALKVNVSVPAAVFVGV